MAFGYARDGQDMPCYMVIPCMKDGRPNLELVPERNEVVDPAMGGSPFAPLPGLFFFDAWRISPSLQRDLPVDKTLKKRSPDNSPLKAEPSQEHSTKERWTASREVKWQKLAAGTPIDYQAADIPTDAALAAAQPSFQKQMLGEALYLRIHAIRPTEVGKITGMLLGQPNPIILQQLRTPEMLAQKVAEAVNVLRFSGYHVAEYAPAMDKVASSATP